MGSLSWMEAFYSSSRFFCFGCLNVTNIHFDKTLYFFCKFQNWFWIWRYFFLTDVELPRTVLFFQRSVQPVLAMKSGSFVLNSWKKKSLFFLFEVISFLVRVSLFVLETTKIKVHSPFRFHIFLSFFFQGLTLFSFTSQLALTNRKAANTTFVCRSFHSLYFI